MKVTESITKIRKSKQLSQAYIAEILQTTQQQYSKYETGMQEIPVRHIIKLCEFYKVTANELLGITTYMTKQEGNSKFQKLYDEIVDILYWAEDQGHITDDQKYLLIQNIAASKEEIEKEMSTDKEQNQP